MRFELTTFSLATRCSTTELRPHIRPASTLGTLRSAPIIVIRPVIARHKFRYLQFLDFPVPERICVLSDAGHAG